jgi:TolB protein
MNLSRKSSPGGAAAVLAVLLLAACSAPAAPAETIPVPSQTPSRTPTCTGILCTPEEGEVCNCAGCAESGTPDRISSNPALTAAPNDGSQSAPLSLLSQPGMLVFTLRSGGFSHLWLWPLGSPDPLPLTDGDFDDRDGTVRPDGGVVAFSSRRDGNWDLYLLDLSSGEVQRFTESAEFEGYPAWSPDSRQLIYERYTNGHLRLAIRRVEDRMLMWSGPDGMDSFEPDWSPLARSISFTGRTGGHTDIYLLNLDTQQIANLTNTPELDERYSAFSPDGESIAYSVKQDGYSWIYRIPADEPSDRPTRIRQGDRPEWSPDGRWLSGVFQPDLLQSYLLFSPSDQQVLSPTALWLTGRIDRLAWSSAVLPNPTPDWLPDLSEIDPIPTSTRPAAGTPISAQLVPLNVNAPDPRLSSAVIQRFQDLREKVKEQAGWDFLATLDSAVIDINTPMPPKEMLSWLRTGRAFAISRGAVSKGWLVVAPDPYGPSEYWRLFVRTALQDGTQGEPLRELPWDFDARTSGTPSAKDSGGGFYSQIPNGFFIDFSQLAAESGFQRIPSNADWRTYYFSIHYWEYVCTDGLDWFDAMGEIYSPYSFLTPTPSRTA